MQSVEFYLHRARESTDREASHQAMQLAMIAAMREVTALLTEVKDLLKENTDAAHHP